MYQPWRRMRRALSVALLVCLAVTALPWRALAQSSEAGQSAAQCETDDSSAGAYYTVTFLGFEGAVLAVQTVAAGAAAEAPDVPNVEGCVFTGWSTDFSAVYADQTVTALYQELGTFTATVNYVFSDGSTAAPPYVEEVPAGAALERVVPSPSLAGFAPDAAQVALTAASMEADLCVTVTYSGATAAYTVQHWVQTLEDDTAYELRDTQTCTGTVGLLTQATAHAYAGFTAQPITNAKVAAGGETVIRVCYTRNTYLFTYDAAGGSYTEAVSLKFGQPIPTADVPTRRGYTFAGWTYTPAVGASGTMPAADVTATASWESVAQADYKVVYWQQRTTDEKHAADSEKTYDFVQAVTCTGAVGQTAAYTPQSYPYFTLNTANTQSGQRIAADGSTVVNVYYDRALLTFQFQYANHTTVEMTGLYGSTLEENGYTWPGETGWQFDSGTGETTLTFLEAFLPPAYASAGTTLVLTEKPLSTRRTYKHYIENLDGAWALENTVQGGDGVFTFSDKYAGFTVSAYSVDGVYYMPTASGRRYSGERGERCDTLHIRYRRNSYTVSFLNAAGVEDVSLLYGASLCAAQPTGAPGRPPQEDDDAVFLGWYYDPLGQTPVNWDADRMPAHNVAVYACWAPAQYTVSFDTQGGAPSVVDPITVEKYQTVQAQMPADPVRTGYVFAGWYTDRACTAAFVPSRQIIRNVTLYAKWLPVDAYPYTVRYEDAQGNALHSPTQGSGAPYATVTVQALAIAGWMPAQMSQSLTLTQPGGQEVVFVYTPLLAWTATARFVTQDGVSLAPDQVYENLTAHVKIVAYRAFAGYELVSAPLVRLEAGGTTQATFVYRPLQNASYQVVHHYGTDTFTEHDTAPVGSMAVATPRLQPGYAVCQTAGNALQGIVRRDGSLVLHLYYTPNRHLLTVLYQYEDGTPACATYAAMLDYGAAYAVESPALAGYTPTEAVATGTMPDSAVTVTVLYRPQTDARPTSAPAQETCALPRAPKTGKERE